MQHAAGAQATDANLAAMRERLELDKPFCLPYLGWLRDFLRGDKGASLASATPITSLIEACYIHTLYVAVLTAAIGVPISLSLRILAAMFPGSLYDRVAQHDYR